MPTSCCPVPRAHHSLLTPAGSQSPRATHNPAVDLRCPHGGSDSPAAGEQRGSVSPGRELGHPTPSMTRVTIISRSHLREALLSGRDRPRRRRTSGPSRDARQRSHRLLRPPNFTFPPLFDCQQRGDDVRQELLYLRQNERRRCQPTGEIFRI